MKTKMYSNIVIGDWLSYYQAMRTTFPGVLGAEHDRDNKTLIVKYEDDAEEIPIEALKALEVPILIRFKKKIPPLNLQLADTKVVTQTENEIVIETKDAAQVRAKIRTLLPDFEEASN